MRPDNDQDLERIREEQAALRKRLDQLEREIAVLMTPGDVSSAPDESSAGSASIQPESTSMSSALREAKKDAVPSSRPFSVTGAQVAKKKDATPPPLLVDDGGDSGIEVGVMIAIVLGAVAAPS